MAVALYPTWPKVRCVKCACVYEPETRGILVVGSCPQCGAATFNTAIAGTAIQGQAK
jgi:predicted  nucleic acid-binding Zn-ribbon protein